MNEYLEGRMVLIVDDDEVFRERLARAFRDRGAQTQTASSGEEALVLVREESPEWAVVDMKMPGMSGLEVVRDIAAIDPTTRVVVLTGYSSIATAIDAVKLGAINYIQKPADVDDIVAAFDRGSAPPLEGTDVDYQAPSLTRVEWEHINRVLTDCAGNISEAARRLGLHRRTLQRKLNKYPPQE